MSEQNVLIPTYVNDVITNMPDAVHKQRTKNSFISRSYTDVGHFSGGSSQKDLDERRKLTEEFLLENGFTLE